MPIAVVGEGRQYAVHADHLNTPRRLTQEDGKVAWQWAYSTFGEEAPTTAATRFTSATTNPTTGSTSVPLLQYNLRYPGQYFDEESGLHYNHFRSYDSKVGRYTQADPIGLEGGWNRFSYAGGNSLAAIDLHGLATLTFTGGGSAVILGGGEGSFGFYISTKPNDIGIIVSGGMGAGANVGLSAQIGYVPGGLSNVSGNTQNTNLSCGIGSGTWMTDPNTGSFAGLTLGPAGRLGASVTHAQTETWGLRGVLDRLFDRIGGLK